MQRTAWILLAISFALLSPARAVAQTQGIVSGPGQPLTLGKLIEGASHIVVLRVERVDREQRTIHFKVAETLKGKRPSARVRQPIPRSEGSPRAAEAILDWARPGKTAIAFHDDEGAHVCLGNSWYWSRLEPPDGWALMYSVDEYLQVYVGSTDKLREHVTAILAGKEVVLTAEAPDPERSWHESPLFRDWLHGKKGKVWRIKVSLKLKEDEKIPFVGWGVGGPESVPGLTAALKHPDSCARAEAAEDLAQLGRVARPAVGGLRAALRDPDAHVRISSAAALARIEPEAEPPLPVLLAALRHKDKTAREAAAGVIAELGRRSLSALPALVAALGDKEASVRRAAAFALGEVSADAPRPGFRPGNAISALARLLLEDKDDQARYWAARSLLSFGADAWAALPALRQALRDKESGVASNAAEILSRFRPPAVGVLVEALLDESCTAPGSVAKCLGSLGPRAGDAVPALLRALRAERTDLRLAAASSLSRIAPGRTDRAIARALAEPLKDFPSSHMRSYLLSRLKPLNPESYSVPFLAAELAEEGGGLAAELLGRAGPRARSAAPALKAALRDKSLSVRVAAAQALWRVSRDQEALTFLAGMLEQPDEEDRWSAAKALAAVGPDGVAAVPALRAALKKVDDPSRPQIAVALWSVGRTVGLLGGVEDHRREALAALIETLRKAPASTRAEAARAIGSLGAEAREALPALLQAINDKDTDIQCCAAGALGELGLDTPAVVRALCAALKDRDEHLRKAALSALCRVKPGHPQALAALKRLAHADPKAIWDFSDELVPLGAKARALAPYFLPALRRESRSHENYQDAVRVLEAIDPHALELAWGPAGLAEAERQRWAKPSPARLQTLWEDLAAADPCKAHQALWGLALAGERAVRALGDRLRPAERVSPQRLARLIDDLGKARYAVRHKATAELEVLAERAEPALRQALKKPVPLEVRRRLAQLLGKLEPPQPAERRRPLRAVEALELIGARAAKQVLEGLAQGAPEAWLTREAQGALRRLGRDAATP
jgi:HEAT repeat protein